MGRFAQMQLHLEIKSCVASRCLPCTTASSTCIPCLSLSIPRSRGSDTISLSDTIPLKSGQRQQSLGRGGRQGQPVRVPWGCCQMQDREKRKIFEVFGGLWGDQAQEKTTDREQRDSGTAAQRGQRVLTGFE